MICTFSAKAFQIFSEVANFSILPPRATLTISWPHQCEIEYVHCVHNTHTQREKKDLCIVEYQNEMDSFCEQIHKSMYAIEWGVGRRVEKNFVISFFICDDRTHINAIKPIKSITFWWREKRAYVHVRLESQRQKQRGNAHMEQKCRFCHGFSWRRQFIKFKIEYKWCLCRNTPRNAESLSPYVSVLVISSLAIIEMTRQKRKTCI